MDGRASPNFRSSTGACPPRSERDQNRLSVHSRPFGDMSQPGACSLFLDHGNEEVLACSNLEEDYSELGIRKVIMRTTTAVGAKMPILRSATSRATRGSRCYSESSKIMMAKGSSSSPNKRPRIPTASGSVEGTWYTGVVYR